MISYHPPDPPDPFFNKIKIADPPVDIISSGSVIQEIKKRNEIQIADPPATSCNGLYTVL